jgi:hypothetical protein
MRKKNLVMFEFFLLSGSFFLRTAQTFFFHPKSVLEQLSKITKINISKILIFEKKKSEKWQDFLSKTSIFIVLPKFDQNNFVQKFKKNLVRKGLNQQKMTRDIDFRAPDGRESMWNTGEKTGFSRVHYEVPKQPNLNFSFRGL